MPESEINKVIADNIVKFLNQRGKSQVDLSEYMGVSQATVSNWCKGKNLFALHNFESSDYETEYLYDDIELLEQIEELIIDTYKKCCNM